MILLLYNIYNEKYFSDDQFSYNIIVRILTWSSSAHDCDIKQKKKKIIIISLLLVKKMKVVPIILLISLLVKKK